MKDKTTFYSLTSVNHTGLGGPMGSERTWDNWTKYYADADLAKKAAQKDFGPTPLKWHSEHGGWRTDDMGHVMYRIRRIHLEHS